MSDYQSFIDSKSQCESNAGFEPLWMPDFLFDFQKSLVHWAIMKGRAAIFADCGLGKTLMQLCWAKNIADKTKKPTLILTPLSVGAQTVREGVRFGIECKQSRDGTVFSPITITNYEQLHKFNPDHFGGIVCDESSVLKHFSGATQKQVTRFALKLPYRSLWTATAAPNDYTELGTSSEALGELEHTDMLTKFFKQDDAKACRMNEVKAARKAKAGNHFAKLSYRVSQQISGWRLRGHAHEPFWKWVCSWARACRKPSDIGFNDKGFDLPELIERDHIIMPSTPPEGELFTLPVFGLREEREERKRTTKERCALAAELVNHNHPAILWCHMNHEGDLLENIIPNSLQVAGRHDDDHKEKVVEWFVGERCICADPEFSARLTAWHKSKNGAQCICGHSSGNRKLISKSKIFGFGLNFQHCNHVVTFATHSYESYYQSVRRCWRFGQKKPVTVDIIASEGERYVRDNMLRKGIAADAMFSKLVLYMNDSVTFKTELGTLKTELPSWL